MQNNGELSRQMLTEHDKAIKEDILPRIEKLEQSFEIMKTDLGKVKEGQSSLELTVMKDGQQTRDLLNKFVDHFFKKDEAEVGVNERITIAKLDRKTKIWLGVLGVLGGGGGVTAGVTALVAMFQ